MATPAQRLQVVTKELMAGHMGGAIKALVSPDAQPYGPGGVVDSVVIDPQDYLGQQDGSPWIHTVDGGGYWHFKYSGCSSSLTAYQRCAPVHSVINRKAQCFINGKTWVLNTKEKEAQGGNAAKVLNLLRRPNPIQSQKEFEAQSYIFQQIFGWTLIFFAKPTGFTDNIDATSMWNIPPSWLTIEEQKRLFYQTDVAGMVKDIVINYRGIKTTLKIQDVYIIRDFTPSFDSLVIPGSRIQSIESAISNWIGAMDSRQTLINYRGMLGIISQDPSGSGAMGGNLPMTPEDKESLQMDVAKYGLRRGQLQFIITKATLKWQQMGYPTKELMLFEECEADAQLVCDAFNYPWRLLAANTSNSLGGSDADIFTRNLYQDAIIPEAENIYEQWTQMFDLENLNLRLDKDYSHIAVLQEDKVKQAEARRGADMGFLIEFQNNLITRNEWRAHLGEDPLPTDGDKYYYELAAAGMTFGGGVKPPTNGQQGQTNADGTPVEQPAS